MINKNSSKLNLLTNQNNIAIIMITIYPKKK